MTFKNIFKIICAYLVYCLFGMVAFSVEDIDKIRSGLQKVSEIESKLGSYECRFKKTSRGELIRDTKIKIKRNGSAVIFSIDNKIICLNDKMMFYIEKSKKNNEWILRQADRVKPESTFRNNLSEMGFSVYPFTSTVGWERLNEIVDDSSFAITSTSINPSGLLDLHFKSEIKKPISKDPLSRMGVMTLSPEFDFAVVKWEETVKYPAVSFPIKYVCTRQIEKNAGVIQCKSIQVSIINDDSKGVEGTESIQFIPLENQSPDPAEFFLSYYGIPIPDDAPEDRPYWYGWWWIIGGVCLAAAFGFKWLARRQADS